MSKFKVGDMVEIIDLGSFTSKKITLGMQGIIATVESSYTYVVDFEELGFSQYSSESCLAPWVDKITTTEHQQLLSQLNSILQL